MLDDLLSTNRREAPAEASEAPPETADRDRCNLLGDLLSTARAPNPSPGESTFRSPSKLPSTADLTAFSVSELKAFIVKHGLSWDDCIEKGELLCRARQALSTTFTSPRRNSLDEQSAANPSPAPTGVAGQDQEAPVSAEHYLDSVDISEEFRALLGRDQLLSEFCPTECIAEMCDGLVLGAKCTVTGLPVAIKVKYMEWSGPQMMQLFSMIQQREIAVNELINEQDPHETQPICRLSRSWETPLLQGEPYLACMVFSCLGQTLGTLFQTTGGVLGTCTSSLPLKALQRITIDLLGALNFLETIQIIHGDIKPVTPHLCWRACVSSRSVLFDRRTCVK